MVLAGKWVRYPCKEKVKQRQMMQMMSVIISPNEYVYFSVWQKNLAFNIHSSIG